MKSTKKTVNVAKTKETPSATAVFSTAASAAATAMLIRSIAKDYLPRELRYYIFSKLNTFINSFSTEMTFIIEEYDNLNHNNLFKAAELYLEPIIPPDAQTLKLLLPNKENNVSVTLGTNQEIFDVFSGVIFKWRFISRELQRTRYIPNPDGYHSIPTTEHRFFQFSFHRKHKNMVLDAYIKHIIEKSDQMKEKKKTLKLFTLSRGDRMMTGRRGDQYPWQSVNLDHPATFDTLAMDMEVKRTIMEDLDRFVKRKEFYKRVGKAWKRGYLLFGPPGTGKSSLIAAMANYLKFDIYDLELTDVRGNSELRKLLISTGNKSILVVEDIDCTIELQDRIAAAKAANSKLKEEERNQVTLSGLLNFIDGLWSSCGDERIIVFTTNHKEKLDPALLRPGRMDMHIHMSYCTPCGFKMLASSYLGIAEHPLFRQVEDLIETAKVSPAEIGEQLMRNEEPEIALSGLIQFLERKNRESVEGENNGSDESKTINESSSAGEAEVADIKRLELNNGEIKKAKDKKKKEMTKIQ